MKLITIEGFERCGKDQLLTNVKRMLPGLKYYEQPTSESTGVSYRETEKFKVILEKHFSKMVDELSGLAEENNEVLVTRFLLSDNIYSDMFGREHILERILKSSSTFELHPFTLLWKDYSEYLKRVEASGSEVEYSEEEFDVIQEKFETYCKRYGGEVLKLSHSDSREFVLEHFMEFYNGLSH